jgi:hypothetical protein
MASIIAIFALARAIIWAFELLEERRVIALRESSPTAMTVRRIIRDNVTISAKPFALNPMGNFAEGFEFWNFMGSILGKSWRKSGDGTGRA